VKAARYSEDVQVLVVELRPVGETGDLVADY